jgi:hypothetical protein
MDPWMGCGFVDGLGRLQASNSVVIEPFSHIFTIEHDDFTMDFT